jgi:hypothetical protein
MAGDMAYLKNMALIVIYFGIKATILTSNEKHNKPKRPTRQTPWCLGRLRVKRNTLAKTKILPRTTSWTMGTLQVRCYTSVKRILS